MDVICPRCGEPWDFDELHEETSVRYLRKYGLEHDEEHRLRPRLARSRYEELFKGVSSEWRSRGCKTFGEDMKCEERDTERTLNARAAYEVCGDDLDGAVATIEDMTAGRGFIR